MPSITVESKPISRREFLYYLWGASGVLALTGACGLSAWYAIPDQQITEKNGFFHINRDILPIDMSQPVQFRDSTISGPEFSFWIVNQPTGLLAFHPICPAHRYRSLAYRWSDFYGSFVCPLCGTHFHLDGTAFYGPSNRSLDRYTIYVTTATGRRQTPPDGSPVSIEGATEIVVYTHRVIKGAPRDWNTT